MELNIPHDTPPSSGTPGDANWQKWFSTLYSATLENGGTFPRLNIVGKEMTASATTERAGQELLTWNCGHYVDRVTQNGNIAYGFAASVRRQAGNAFTVGAQLDALADRGATTSVFGYATESIGLYRFLYAIIGGEITAACFDDTNTSAKWGLNSVFKNRTDLSTTVPYGVGANSYNYFANALVVTAQTRSAAGERCGWTRGLSFLGNCFDAQTPPAWSATKTYIEGMVVTSGGRSWQCIAQNLNVVPAVPSAFWCFNAPAGAAAAAVGIDFVSVSAFSAARMASAIRLQDFMRIHWDVTGSIGTYFDSFNGWHVVTENNGVNILGVYTGGVNTGIVFTSQPERALGGGAGATLGTIGAAPGPAGAAQTGWMAVILNAQLRWVPTWT